MIKKYLLRVFDFCLAYRNKSSYADSICESIFDAVSTDSKNKGTPIICKKEFTKFIKSCKIRHIENMENFHLKLIKSYCQHRSKVLNDIGNLHPIDDLKIIKLCKSITKLDLNRKIELKHVILGVYLAEKMDKFLYSKSYMIFTFILF